MTESSLAQSRSSYLVRVVFRILLRGEFRLRSALILMSVYGAAILVIPLVLSSVFSVSIAYLGLVGNFAQQELIRSIYSEISATYDFVEGLLFVGLAITCVLSGMSIGRKARSAESLLSQLGVESKTMGALMLIVLLSVSLFAVAFGFSLAIILSSASLFSMSILFGVPSTEIAVGNGSFMYLLLLLGVGYVSLVLGWARTRRRT